MVSLRGEIDGITVIIRGKLTRYGNNKDPVGPCKVCTAMIGAIKSKYIISLGKWCVYSGLEMPGHIFEWPEPLKSKYRSDAFLSQMSAAVQRNLREGKKSRAPNQKSYNQPQEGIHYNRNHLTDQNQGHVQEASAARTRQPFMYVKSQAIESAIQDEYASIRVKEEVKKGAEPVNRRNDTTDAAAGTAFDTAADTATVESNDYFNPCLYSLASGKQMNIKKDLTEEDLMKF